jgi:hypothetical protein
VEITEIICGLLIAPGDEMVMNPVPESTLALYEMDRVLPDWLRTSELVVVPPVLKVADVMEEDDGVMVTVWGETWEAVLQLVLVLHVVMTLTYTTFALREMGVPAPLIVN